MKILAVDSSGLVASAALVEDDNLIAEYTVQYKKTHSQTLLPMLDEIVRMTEAQLSETDAIAVAAGPGSFTGLRIGAATVKGLGLALEKPVIGIPTVEALAMNLYGAGGLICPLMDARRNQVYTGIYRFAGGMLEAVKDPCAVALEEILDELNTMGETVSFLGDGVAVYKEQIEQRLGVPHQYAPANVNKQRASAVAVCALRRMAEGICESADAFSPVYLRLSQAERERKERQLNEEEAEEKE